MAHQCFTNGWHVVIGRLVVFEEDRLAQEVVQGYA